MSAIFTDPCTREEFIVEYSGNRPPRRFTSPIFMFTPLAALRALNHSQFPDGRRLPFSRPLGYLLDMQPSNDEARAMVVELTLAEET